MNPERDPWPSVPESEAEQLFREASDKGVECVSCYDAAAVCGWTPRLMAMAASIAAEAASLYHEGLRHAGECPLCGDQRVGYHDSVGCCIEPTPLTFDEALWNVTGRGW